MSRHVLASHSFYSTAEASDGRVELTTPVGDVDFVPDSPDGEGFLFRPGAGRPAGYLLADWRTAADGTPARSYLLLSPDKRRQIGHYPNQLEAIVALFEAKETL